ncbi:rhodanese-like domain-containing protein [Streptococcus uberis]|uniref:rhodanese-like domain-containing protein n=1 Tax=Streptococcus uberis TaxID=1349 RepID=UPI002FEC32E7
MIKSESISELKNALASQNINLIDVREVDEYKSGHVPTAKNMPLSTLVEGYLGLDKEKTYHIICQSGGRSARACDFLEEKGYHVINVTGGTVAWDGPLV